LLIINTPQKFTRTKESVAEHSFEVAQTHVDRQVSYWFAGILAFMHRNACENLIL